MSGLREIFERFKPQKKSDGGLSQAVGQVLNKPEAPKPVEPAAVKDIKRWPLPFEAHVKGSATWSESLRSLIRASSIPDLKLEDSKEYCPQYDALSREQRIEFWAHWFGITTKYECSYDPTEASVDVGHKDDKDTWSVGLFQMSVVDQKNHGFNLGYSFTDLQNPIKNMILAIRIAEKLMKQDLRVAGQVDGHWKGLARYWGTMREGRSSFNGIKQYVEGLDFELSNQKTVEPEKPAPIEKGKMLDWYPKAIKYAKRMKTRGKYAQGYPVGAVVHFTAGRDGAAKTIDGGIENGYAYVCIQKDGKMVQAHPISEWGYHAGESAWRHLAKKLVGSVSDDLIGIEINAAGRCEPASNGTFKTWFGTYLTKDQVRYTPGKANQLKGWYEKYTPEQEATLIEFLLWLKGQAPEIFDFDFVLGHDEVAGPAGIGRWRKNDPGAALSMTMPEFRELLKKRWADLQKTGA